MRRIAALALAGAVLLGTPQVAQAERHKDEKLGYQVTYPKKWKSMPLSHEEQWMVAKFVSPRQYEWNGEGGSSWTYHTPYLDVVVIPFAAAERKDAEVEETEDGIRVKRAAPWTNLREYLDKTCRSIGGFHFSGEEVDEVRGLKVMKYEITVDKLVSGERKVLAWAYYTDDCIYGLVAEILSCHEKKLRPLIESSFRSFKAFPRSGALPGTAHTGDDIVVKRGPGDDEEVSDEDLTKRRQSLTRRMLLRIKENLPDDWTITESDNFIAVSHADRKYTKETLAHAEALREWLDEDLGFVGNGYAGKCIIRICADDEERNAYSRSRGWLSDDIEVLTNEDKNGWGDWAMESLNREIFGVWIRDKNKDLEWGGPAWLSNGLKDLIERAVSKRGKVTFPPDEWDQQKIAELRRAEKLLPASDFFRMTSEELWGDWENHRQAEFFVRFLVVGGAEKSKSLRSIFSDYMKSLIFLMDEEDDPDTGADADAEDEDEDSGEPKTEEEEDAMYKERQSAWRAKERERLLALIERTFPDWDEKDWDKLDKAYAKDLK